MVSSVGDGSPREVLNRERGRMFSFLNAHGAVNVRVFGSLARGDDDRASDIDLLVELAGDRSGADELLTVLGLSVELSELLGVRVGVATPRTLRSNVLDAALAESVPL
jgi:uncharacterized protein